MKCLRAFYGAGFFLAPGQCVCKMPPFTHGIATIRKGTHMNAVNTDMARKIAEVAAQFQRQRTGHAPRSVTVVLGQDTVVVTLHEALSPAEKALAQTAAGAARVQEFHRQLFAHSSDTLRREIRRITGRRVQEAVAEVEPATGAVIHAFTTGTVVQVFSFDHPLPGDTPDAIPAPNPA